MSVFYIILKPGIGPGSWLVLIKFAECCSVASHTSWHAAGTMQWRCLLGVSFLFDLLRSQDAQSK